jgi:D-alanine-D-alanine ligase-like ATP-grasp enzyme
MEVPGTAALNQSGNAVTSSVSCASAGNCSAGGYYTDGATQAFVVNETDGTWGKAEEIPDTAALNQGGDAQVSEVSCVSAGNCAVGGTYTDGSGNNQAFVANETDGTWGKAEEIPGAAALGGETTLDVLSCGTAGNCSAGGGYSDGSGNFQAFVVSEIDGTWGTAEEVPGTAALNQGGDAHVGALSCVSAGNCSAGGSYFDASGNTQVFVVNETAGTWGAAEEVPGTATVNKGAIFGTQLFSVSCASAGDCAAGGFYTDGSGDIVAFVVNETDGTWGTVQEVPGIANQGFAQTLSVSCVSAGNCSAGGNYGDSSGTQAFVVNETNGSWGASEQVPGTASLNQGGDATTNSVSCGSVANCAAVGSYNAGSGETQVFVTNEINGTWGAAEEVPGTAALNKGGNATINSVSCGSAGNCSAGGSYSDKSFHIQAFVVSES